MSHTETDGLAAWSDAVQRWLSFVYTPLCEHAIHVAQGDRGVLVVEANTAQLEAMLAGMEAPDTTTVIGLTPLWLPIDAFLESIRDAHDDRTAWRRWQAPLAVMDPRRDVALFIHTDPNAEPGIGHYSRFLVLNSEHPPVH